MYRLKIIYKLCNLEIYKKFIIFFLLITSICCYSFSDNSEEKRNNEVKQKTISDSIIEQLEGNEQCSENIDTSNFMKAYKVISNTVAKPDTLMMLDKEVYLAVIRSINTDDSGLYIIDLKKNIPEKLNGGSPTIIRTNEEKNGYKWVLVSHINQSEVKKKLVYSTLVFNPKESDNKSFSYYKLTSFNDYYETCTCDEKYEITPNSLKEIEKLNRIDIKDEDEDGFLDIIFSTISLDCVTSERKTQKKCYLFTKNGFVEKIETLFQDTVFEFQKIDEIMRMKSFESKMKIAKDSTKHSVYDFFSLDYYKNRSLILKKFYDIDDCTRDTLFDYIYSNGIAIIEDKIFIINDAEQTPKGLSIGATRQDMYRIYGEPIRESENLSIYLCQDEVQKTLSGYIEYYEAVYIYFKNDKVFAISIYRPGTC